MHPQTTSICHSHHPCILYLLEHDKLILCIVPPVDLTLIPETAHKYQSRSYHLMSERLNNDLTAVQFLSQKSYFVL